MDVPAVVIAELSKCGGRLVTTLIHDVVKFNTEKLRLKCTVVNCVYGVVKIYEDYNKVYIESNNNNMERILAAIPEDADPNQVMDLLVQCKKGNDVLSGIGLVCGTVLGSAVVIALGIAMKQPPQTNISLISLKK